jgi:hypothetical protein
MNVSVADYCGVQESNYVVVDGPARYLLDTLG